VLPRATVVCPLPDANCVLFLSVDSRLQHVDVTLPASWPRTVAVSAFTPRCRGAPDHVGVRPRCGCLATWCGGRVRPDHHPAPGAPACEAGRRFAIAPFPMYACCDLYNMCWDVVRCSCSHVSRWIDLSRKGTTRHIVALFRLDTMRWRNISNVDFSQTRCRKEWHPVVVRSDASGVRVRRQHLVHRAAYVEPILRCMNCQRVQDGSKFWSAFGMPSMTRAPFCDRDPSTKVPRETGCTLCDSRRGAWRSSGLRLYVCGPDILPAKKGL